MLKLWSCASVYLSRVVVNRTMFFRPTRSLGCMAFNRPLSILTRFCNVSRLQTAPARLGIRIHQPPNYSFHSGIRNLQQNQPQPQPQTKGPPTSPSSNPPTDPQTLSNPPLRQRPQTSKWKTSSPTSHPGHRWQDNNYPIHEKHRGDGDEGDEGSR